MTFEECLGEIHYEAEPWLLDDDLPDAFNEWLGNRDVDEMIEYGQKYGDMMVKKLPVSPPSTVDGK